MMGEMKPREGRDQPGGDKAGTGSQAGRQVGVLSYSPERRAEAVQSRQEGGRRELMMERTADIKPSSLQRLCKALPHPAAHFSL